MCVTRRNLFRSSTTQRTRVSNIVDFQKAYSSVTFCMSRFALYMQAWCRCDELNANANMIQIDMLTNSTSSFDGGGGDSGCYNEYAITEVAFNNFITTHKHTIHFVMVKDVLAFFTLMQSSANALDLLNGSMWICVVIIILMFVVISKKGLHFRRKKQQIEHAHANTDVYI